jgi:hypothetical protein
MQKLTLIGEAMVIGLLRYWVVALLSYCGKTGTLIIWNPGIWNLE